MKTTKTGYIYKLTSPSGKSYIGQTTNIKKRFYIYETLRCKSQPKIYNALLKYGYENFKKEILITFNDYNNLNELKEMLDTNEVNCIRIFNSFEAGYNCTLGGEGSLGLIHTEEVRARIRKSSIGKIISEETKLKLSVVMYGKKKKHSAETIEKCRLCNIGKPKSPESIQKRELTKRKNRLAKLEAKASLL